MLPRCKCPFRPRPIRTMKYRSPEPVDPDLLAPIYAKAFALPPYEENWTIQKALQRVRDHFEKHPDTSWVIYKTRPDLPLGAALGVRESETRWIIQECFIEPFAGRSALGDLFVRRLFEDLRIGGTRPVELFLERHSPDYSFMRGLGMRTPSHMRMFSRFPAPPTPDEP